MRPKTKFKLIFSGMLALTALVLNWLLLHDTSPLHQYFIWHGDIPNLWAALNIVPVLVSAIVAGDPHSGSEAVYLIADILQWFIIGYLLSGAMSALKSWES